MVNMKHLHSRAQWKIKIKTVTPIHIGAGDKEEQSNSDAAIRALLDTSKEGVTSFLLPGSSFKGITRHYLNNVAKTFQTPHFTHFISELYGESEDQRRYKGRIWFDDVHIPKEHEAIKNMTPINRLNQIPVVPLTLQAVKPDVSFELNLTIENATANDYALVGILLRAFDEQLIQIGAGASRGLGRLQLQCCTTTIHQYGRDFVTEDNIQMPAASFQKERKLLTTTYIKSDEGRDSYTWLQFATKVLVDNLKEGEVH